MKVYVSGPIKDNSNYVDDFTVAETYLIGFGYEVVNPVTIDHPADATYADYMREDIRAMLDCRGIYMLRGWELSQGAKLEFLVATMTNMNVMYQR